MDMVPRTIIFGRGSNPRLDGAGSDLETRYLDTLLRLIAEHAIKIMRSPQEMSRHLKVVHSASPGCQVSPSPFSVEELSCMVHKLFANSFKSSKETSIEVRDVVRRFTHLSMNIA